MQVLGDERCLPGPTHPEQQATWEHYNTSINIAIDIILQYSASLAHSLKQRAQCVKIATRAYCIGPVYCEDIQEKLWAPPQSFYRIAQPELNSICVTQHKRGRL